MSFIPRFQIELTIKERRNMKAVQIRQYGGIEVIEIDNEAPVPEINETQLLVEVTSVSLNPVDWKFRNGAMKASVHRDFPLTLGGDFSGVVRVMGSGVSGFSIGEPVYGQAIILNGSSGAFADYVAVNMTNVYKKPLKADFDEAASMPLAGVSALQALEEQLRLQKGQAILIHGGAGGIGHYAVQFAKKQGAFVAVTVGTRDILFVKELGADIIIDYTKDTFDDLLKNYDAVLDTVGGDVYTRSFKVLRKGGTINSMVEKPDPALSEKYGVTARLQFTVANTDRLRRLAGYTDMGAVRAYVDRIFRIEEIREAFSYFEKDHTRGKVVVRIK
jgi:NADPH:quinone reductase-like Zn-dependent oxidoreductase